MHSIALLSLCIILGLTAAIGTGPALAERKLPCESRSPGGDNRDFICPLSLSGAPQRFAFKADFSGSHDDTTAAMTATLDGMPLTCEKGSKTSLAGEDGEVSLECRFTVKESTGTNPVLRVTLTWRHAQYTDFELFSE
jgi:hypothetical protein